MPLFRDPKETSPLPRWPILRGIYVCSKAMCRFLLRALIWCVRSLPVHLLHGGKATWRGLLASPSWVPLVLAYIFAPWSILLFGLRYAGGAYDLPQLRKRETYPNDQLDRDPADPPDLRDPVGPVDSLAKVWRTFRARRECRYDDVAITWAVLLRFWCCFHLVGLIFFIREVLG